MRKGPKRNPLLRCKGELTKLQILLEVMRNQPHIKQKNIADTLDITVQAVSKYFKKLSRESLLEAGTERADYRLTPKATAKLHDEIQKLESYVNSLKSELKIERAIPAIATRPLKAGEEVGIIMNQGVIYTAPPEDPKTDAKGIAIDDAEAGEDVGLRDLRGKLKLKQGEILIIKLPSIKHGGSRAVDIDKVKGFYTAFKPDRVGVMGAVGRAVLNKLDLKPDLEFGLSGAAAIAASRGLKVFVLVVGRMVNRMIEEIDTINLKNSTEVIYEIKEGRKHRSERI